MAYVSDPGDASFVECLHLLSHYTARIGYHGLRWLRFGHVHPMVE